MNTEFSSFLCPTCHTEIQASSDMIGQHTECPACGTRLLIPEASQVVRHSADDPDPEALSAMKSRTIRIELGDI